MSVDPNDALPGANDAAGALIARASRGGLTNTRLRAAAADLATSDADRLDDEAREVIRGDLDRLIGAIETDLRQYAGRAGNGRTAAALAPSEGLIQRMIAAGLLEDDDLVRELTDRAWSTIIAARLPLAAELDTSRPSLLPRLANGPDHVIASAASAVLTAEVRRRGRSPDAGRDDLPAELHHRLVWWTAAALRPVECASLIELALTDGARRALGAHDEGARLEAAADRLVLAIDPSDDALLELIDCALDDRRLELIASLLGHAAGVDSAAARTVLLDPTEDRLWLMLRACGLPRGTIARIALALAEADRRRDPGRFVDAVDPLMAMPAAVAAAAIAAIKLPAVYRDALERLA
jgi:hypothetical protein